MMKKALLFGVLPIIMGFMIIGFLFVGLGGGGSIFVPAEEETATEYQVIGSELGVDWTWPMLINIFQAEKNRQDLNSQNPVYAALNCLKVTIDVYSKEEDEDGDSHWVYDYSDYANGAEEILSYFGLPAETRDVYLTVNTIEGWKSEKYRVRTEAYSSLDEVLNTYYDFSEDVLSEIYSLNEDHYLAELYGQEFYYGSGDGMLDGEIILPSVGLKIPLYYQYQQPWGGIRFGDGTITTSGCSVTCIAMVFSYLKNSTITPDQVAAWAGFTYHMPGKGAKHEIFPAAARKWGLSCTSLGTNMELVVRALSDGKPVIASMDKGTFTRGGHFIILRGITEEGKILVNDPNDNAKKQHFNRSFDLSLIKREAKGFWCFK
jgi:hypothetical protein